MADHHWSDRYAGYSLREEAEEAIADERLEEELSERAHSVLGPAAIGSPLGDLAAALDEVERLRLELAASPTLLSRKSGSGQPSCWCFDCLNDESLGLMNPTNLRLVVCPDCGNKRCPRATNHRHACTGSNEPGQPGSRYGGLPAVGR